jgi:mannosyltransferase
MPSANALVSLDCIVLGLQRFGGISNYWNRLLRYTAASGVNAPGLVLPKTVSSQEFDPRTRLERAVLDERLPPGLTRYLPAPMLPGTQVFHTSYYRTPRSRVHKHVVTVYDFTYERYRSGLAKHVHSWQKLNCIRRADEVLCISSATRQDVLEFCPGVDASRVHVVHLGVDTSTYFPDAASAEAEDVVLFVGQRQGYKRFDLAVEAVARLPSLKLGIVGPSITPQEQQMLSDRLGTRWHAYGPVGSERLRRLYSESFAFIFPSDYEGFGLPVLEAMACGCPVIAAARSSLPEVGGQAALYADEQRADDYAAGLQRIFDSSVRDRLVADGLMRAQSFDWSTTFERTVGFYRI